MFSRKFLRNLSAILVFLVINLMVSCYTTRRLDLKNGAFVEEGGTIAVPLEKRALVIPVDNENVWLLEGVTLSETLIEAAGVKKVTPAKAGEKADEVISLYLRKGTTVAPAEGQPLAVPITDIERAEIKELDTGATIVVVVSSVLLGAAAVFGLVILIILATKSSCPFVYVKHNGEYRFAGEIFSGAVFPDQERDDFLPLAGATAEKGDYEVKIVNAIRNEIQYNNLAELIVCDHPAGTAVLLDKYGAPHSLRDIQAPVRAANGSGLPVREELSGRDDERSYVSTVEDENNLTDAVVCEFKRPAGASRAKLFVRAKNTFWLEYAYKRFWYLFGSRYASWVKEKAASTADPGTWKDLQHITLGVSVRAGGAWRAVDTFPIAGPVAFRDHVMAVDLAGVPAGETVAVRLESGRGFWEIDAVGMDFSDDAVVGQTKLPPRSAIDQEGRDLSAPLALPDRSYYVQARYRDEGRLRFAAPAAAQPERTVFLHTRGYYLVTLDPEPSGPPETETLLRMREAGEFNRFSNRLFLSLKEKLTHSGTP